MQLMTRPSATELRGVHQALVMCTAAQEGGQASERPHLCRSRTIPEDPFPHYCPTLEPSALEGGPFPEIAGLGYMDGLRQQQLCSCYPASAELIL